MDNATTIISPTYSPFAGGLLVFIAVVTIVYVCVFWWRSGSWIKWPISFFIVGVTVTLIFGFITEFNKFGNLGDALGETGNGGLGISFGLLMIHLFVLYLRKGVLFLVNRFWPHKIAAPQASREKGVPHLRLILEIEGKQKDITHLPIERQTEILHSIKDSDTGHTPPQKAPLAADQRGMVSMDLLEQIAALIIAMAIIGTALFTYIKYGKISQELSAPVGMVVGYFFGQRKRYRDIGDKELHQISEEDIARILAQTRKE